MEPNYRIKLVIAPDILADLLANYDGEGSLIPGTEGLDVEVVYSIELYYAVKSRLEAAGTPFGTTADALLTLQRVCARAEPANEKQIFDDRARDMLVRLAVGAGVDYVVSNDSDLLDLGEWEGAKFVPTVAAAIRAVLAGVPTVPVFPAETETEARIARKVLAGVPTVPVFRAATEIEAQIAREVLEKAGIRYLEASRQIPWYDGIMTIGEGFYGELYVLEKDYDRAAELLEEYVDNFGEEIDD